MPHNRPLFVTDYVLKQRVNRMLLDGGLVVNILPLRTLREMGISIDELFQSRLMIKRFNQGGQRESGMLRLEILIEDMASNFLFYVIDTKTSYKFC
jgi:hypothetical protein